MREKEAMRKGSEQGTVPYILGEEIVVCSGVMFSVIFIDNVYQKLGRVAVASVWVVRGCFMTSFHSLLDLYSLNWRGMCGMGVS